MTNDELLNEINKLKQELDKLKYEYSKHQHSDVDGTNSLRKSLNLDLDQTAQIGLGSIGTLPIRNPGASNEQIGLAIALSKDTTKGFLNKLNGMQLNFVNSPNNPDSFITAVGGILVSSFTGTSISTSSGGSTITIDGYNFTTNELAGETINIYNSSGTFIESHKIASNTSTVVTISGTWSSNTSGGTFLVYKPVYLGSAETIFERAYVNQEESGGIRFGIGKTGSAGVASTTGLLYMDSVGDLYWRDKAGTAIKLNV